MEEWEFHAIVEKSKMPKIEKLVDEEIFLNKFYAETARKFLAVHDHFQINLDTIFDNTKNWVEKIKNEVVAYEEDR